MVGLGDRHVQNILVDCNTAELIHIDLGKERENRNHSFIFRDYIADRELFSSFPYVIHAYLAQLYYMFIVT